MKTEKDFMVAMRDRVRIAVDVYRPDVEGKKFPAILAWGKWGKNVQEAIRWLRGQTPGLLRQSVSGRDARSRNLHVHRPQRICPYHSRPEEIGDSEGDQEPTGSRTTTFFDLISIRKKTSTI